MAVHVKNNLDLNKYELLNIVIHSSVNDLTSPVDGQLYWNSTSDILKIYDADDTEWKTIAYVYSFQNSLSETGNVVTLVGDESSPGLEKYYGTNDSGVKGYYDLPTGAADHILLGPTHTDTETHTPVRGDIITAQQATPEWRHLAIGSLGDVLYSDGTDVSWQPFTNLSYWSRTTGTPDYLSPSNVGDVILLPDNDSICFRDFTNYIHSSATDVLRFYTADSIRLQFDAAGVKVNQPLIPYTDGGFSVGTATLRWDDIFLSGEINFTDTNTQIWEDGSSNLTFKDANAGTLTLTELYNGLWARQTSPVNYLEPDTAADSIYTSEQFHVGGGINWPWEHRLNLAHGHLAFETVVAPQTAPTAALAGAGAGNVDDGLHYYYVQFVTDYGHTGYDNDSEVSITVTDQSTDGQVDLSNIPVGAANQRVTGRKIFRTKAGVRYIGFLLTTINDNTTTTYRDNTADSALGTEQWYRSENTTGGEFYWNNNLFLSSGYYHTRLGRLAFNAAQNLYGNVGFGPQAGRQTTTGTQNTFIGFNAGDGNEAGGSQVFVGHQAGRLGKDNTNTVAIGTNSLYFASNATYNVAVGSYTLQGVSGQDSGNYNTVIGSSSGRYLQGSENTFLGYYSGFGVSGSSSGSYNIFLGAYTGDTYTSGSYNLLIGYNVDLDAADSNYQFKLGYNTVIIAEGSLASGSAYLNSPYNMYVRKGDSGVTPVASVADLYVESDANSGIYIMNPDAYVGSLIFGTPTDSFGALIRWDYTNDLFSIGTQHTGGKINFTAGNGILNTALSLHQAEFFHVDDTATGYFMDFIHERSTGQTAVDNDMIATISSYFYNSNATPEKIEATRIEFQVTDNTDGTENGTIRMYTMNDTTLQEVVTLEDNTFALGYSSAGVGMFWQDGNIFHFYNTTGSYGFQITTNSNDLKSVGGSARPFYLSDSLGVFMTIVGQGDNVQFHRLIKPDTTDSKDIGTSSLFWKDVYAQKYYIDTATEYIENVSNTLYFYVNGEAPLRINSTTVNVYGQALAIRREEDTTSGAEILISKERATGSSSLDNDYVFEINGYFYNDNATPEYLEGGGIALRVIDASDTTEDTLLYFRQMEDGTLTTYTISDFTGGTTYNSGNAITIDGSNNIDLGGTMDAATTIQSNDATHTLIIQSNDTSGDTSSRLAISAATIYMEAYSQDDYATAGGYAHISADHLQATFRYSDDGTDIQEIEFDGNTTGMTVTDTVGSKGLYYAADYKTGATDRWIPDKAYVDSVAAGYGGTTGSIQYNTGSGISGNEFLHWDSSNNYLYVGETAHTTGYPGAGIHVYLSNTTLAIFETYTNATGWVRLKAPSGYDTQVQFYEGTTMRGAIGCDATADSINIRSGSGDFSTSDAIIVGGSQHVGFGGEESSTAQIYVNANVSGYAAYFFNDGGTDSYDGIKIQCGPDDQTGASVGTYVDCYDGNGDPEGGLECNTGTFQIFQGSDRRIKTNIIDTEINASVILNDLPIRDFNRIHRSTGNIGVRQTGYIAQEVHKIYPIMANYKEKIDLWTTAPTRLIPILHKGWKEHEDEISKLKKRIKELELKIEKNGN